MRIFFLSAADILTDHEANGEGLIAWNLLEALSRRGHEIVACAKYNRVVGDASFEIVELGPCSSHALLSDLAYARAASAEFQRRTPARFDIAHWLFPNGAYGLLKTQVPRGVPFVVGPLMDSWPSNRPWWPPGYIADRMLRPYLRAAQSQVHERATRVLVTYDGMLDRMSPSVRVNAIEIPFGIDLDVCDAPSWTLPNKPRVLFVGRLEESKGVVDLLDAAAILSARSFAFELAFVGEGTLAGMLADLVSKRGVAENVRVLGRLSAERVREEMTGSSLICLPSHGEPFGMVLLEAMRAGRAVVATAAGGPASIVVDGEGGRLVEPRNPLELAHALEALLADRVSLEAAGRFNRRRVEQRYALPVVVAQLEETYKAVALDDPYGRV